MLNKLDHQEVRDRLISFRSMEPMTIFSQLTVTLTFFPSVLTETSTSVEVARVWAAKLKMLGSDEGTWRRFATVMTAEQIMCGVLLLSGTSQLSWFSFIPPSLAEIEHNVFHLFIEQFRRSNRHFWKKTDKKDKTNSRYFLNGLLTFHHSKLKNRELELTWRASLEMYTYCWLERNIFNRYFNKVD